jgi:hypothetical protein
MRGSSADCDFLVSIFALAACAAYTKYAADRIIMVSMKPNTMVRVRRRSRFLDGRVHDVRWREFEELGEEEVPRRLGAHIWSEEKERLAYQWLELGRQGPFSATVENEALPNNKKS